jgi:hypothetical protein
MILNPEPSLNPELKPAMEPRNAGPAPLPESRPAGPVAAPPRAPRRPRPKPEILHLPLSRRTVLVTADVVRAVYGVEAEAVTAKVDNGELQWVFDVSVRGNHVRVPRFWARELMAPGQCQMTPAQAVEMILGPDRQNWRSTEIQQLLMTSRATMMRWHRSRVLRGKTKGRTVWVTRGRLERFLLKRLWWKEL